MRRKSKSNYIISESICVCILLVLSDSGRGNSCGIIGGRDKIVGANNACKLDAPTLPEETISSTVTVNLFFSISS